MKELVFSALYIAVGIVFTVLSHLYIIVVIFGYAAYVTAVQIKIRQQGIWKKAITGCTLASVYLLVVTALPYVWEIRDAIQIADLVISQNNSTLDSIEPSLMLTLFAKNLVMQAS